MPDVSNVYIDPVLTNLAVGYRNGNLVADQLFPTIPVTRRTGVYWQFGKESFGMPRTLRAPKTRAAKVDFAATQLTYAVENHALAMEIADEERDNADSIMQLETRKVRLITDLLLLGREKRVADLATDAAVITQNTTPSIKWNTIATAIPVEDVRNAKIALRTATGLDANFMVIPRTIVDQLMLVKTVIDRIKYTVGLGQITMDVLKALFGMDNILIPSAKYNTAQEGDTVALTDVWPDTVVLGYVNNVADIEAMSLGYMFRQQAPQVTRWREEDIKTDSGMIEVIEKAAIVCPEAGYLLTDCLA